MIEFAESCYRLAVSGGAEVQETMAQFMKRWIHRLNELPDAWIILEYKRICKYRAEIPVIEEENE